MQPASLEADDDYFETIKNYLDPEITRHVEFTEELRDVSKKILKFRMEHGELRKQIIDMEKRIEKFDSDLKILADTGEKLVSNEMKEKIRDVCEEYIIENRLDQARLKLKELYDKQSAYLQIASPLIGDFHSIQCQVCLKDHVYMYNKTCGHTICFKCSVDNKDMCPICREKGEYQSLNFNFKYY